MHLISTIPSPITILQPQPPPPSTPAFLSRFPRSLSSLSLGTKKKSTEKDVPPAITPTAVPLMPLNSSFASELLVPSQMATPTKKKFSGSQRDLKSADIPPPLPQRNIPRKMPACDGSENFSSDGVVLRRNLQVSDLDCNRPLSSNSSGNVTSSAQSPNRRSPSTSSSSGGGGKGKQRQKQKKALSDPKMSSQLLIDMEQTQGSGVPSTGNTAMGNNEAPPLPPRQPGMLEEKQNFLNSNKFGNNGSRPLPNSLETHMNYPLIATCTAVRDNISPFPLSHRPNIVQQLQQSYNNQHHLTTLPSSTSTTTSSISKTTVSNFI